MLTGRRYRPNLRTTASRASSTVEGPTCYEKIGAEAFGTKQPIGTGPYRFVEWQRGQHIVLEANPDYWGGPPTPRRLMFRFIADPSTRGAELKAEAWTSSPARPSPSSRSSPPGDTAIVTVPAVRVIAYPFNTLQKPLGDVRVRRALNLGVDRETIVKTLLQGYGKPTGQPFIPGWLGYDPEIKPFPYDPAQARKLLAEAGYPSYFAAQKSDGQNIGQAPRWSKGDGWIPGDA